MVFGRSSQLRALSYVGPLAQRKRPCLLRRNTLFDGELHLVGGVQLGFVVRGDDAELEDMFAGFDAVERAFFAFEHAHQLAVHVGVGVVAALAFGELELDGNFVAFEKLAFARRNNLDTRTLGRLGCRFAVFAVAALAADGTLRMSCCAQAKSGSAASWLAAIRLRNVISSSPLADHFSIILPRSKD